MKIEIRPEHLLFVMAIAAALYFGWRFVGIVKVVMAKLDKVIVSLESAAALPDGIKALKQIAILQVSAVQKLNASVESFRSALFTGGSQEAVGRSPVPAFMEHDEEAHFAQGEIEALVEAGVPRAEAEERVKALQQEVKNQMVGM